MLATCIWDVDICQTKAVHLQGVKILTLIKRFGLLAQERGWGFWKFVRWRHEFANLRLSCKGSLNNLKGKVAHIYRWPTWPEFNPVSVAQSKVHVGTLLLCPDGMLVHRRVTPSIFSPVPIYTIGWKETMWSKVSCLKRQHSLKTKYRKSYLNNFIEQFYCIF